jgi:plastocyanin
LAFGVPLVGTPASGGTNEVRVRDNSFAPETISVSLGATVQWRSASTSRASHNVREDRKIFRSGAPTPNAIQYSRRFSAGTFHYYCEIHGFSSGGMAGLIKVPVRIADLGEGGLSIGWATAQTNTGSRFDVDFRVGAGSWRPWKRNASAKSATFGASGEPVRLEPGVRYSFRARSLRDGRASRWSPVRSFTP